MAVLRGGAVSYERGTPVVFGGGALQGDFTPPHPITLDISLLTGPGGGRFLMSEVPLQRMAFGQGGAG